MNTDNYARRLHAGVNNITNWLRRGEVFPSQWGNLTYEEWCRKEAARWDRTGKPVVVHVHEDICCIGT